MKRVHYHVWVMLLHHVTVTSSSLFCGGFGLLKRCYRLSPHSNPFNKILFFISVSNWDVVWLEDCVGDKSFDESPKSNQTILRGSLSQGTRGSIFEQFLLVVDFWNDNCLFCIFYLFIFQFVKLCILNFIRWLNANFMYLK